jgi:hypothetical protein
MNPEQYLSVVETLIVHRPISGNGKWDLGWHNGKIVILPNSEAARLDHHFLTIDALDVTQGLTLSKWQDLKAQLAQFLEMKGLL